MLAWVGREHICERAATLCDLNHSEAHISGRMQQKQRAPTHPQVNTTKALKLKRFSVSKKKKKRAEH